MTSPEVLFGAIEAGGTKFVCAVGSGPDDIRAQERFDTTLPAETIGRCLAFLQRFDGQGEWGGNLDIRDVAAGNKIFLPVHHAGARFYLGDVHASQGGQGEWRGYGGNRGSNGASGVTVSSVTDSTIQLSNSEIGRASCRERV